MTENKCPSCQSVLDADATFCNECGAVQAAAVAPPVVRTEAPILKDCPQCAKPVADNVKFCPKCAFDFTKPPVAEVCPQCSKAFGADDKFCRHCAFDLSTSLKKSSANFCTKCGEPFEVTDHFCRNCAADLSQSNHTVAVPIIGSSAPAASSASLRVEPIRPVLAAPAVPVAASSASGPHWISPSASAFVVICFFLPWLEFSACGINKQVSGAEIAQSDGSFWLFPLTAIVSLGAYFFFKNQSTLWKARPFVLIASGLGLLFLMYKASTLNSGPEIMGYQLNAASLGIKPHIGAFGTAFGFVGAMIGCIFMGAGGAASKFDSSFVPMIEPIYSRGAAQMNGLQAKIAGLKPNIAAMYCYIAPLVLPIVASFVLGFLLALIGSVMLMFLSYPLIVATAFGFQVLLLKNPVHQTNPFVRFHAWQSIFSMGCYFVIQLCVAGLFWLSLSGPGGPGGGAQLLILLIYGVGLVTLVGMIFLAVKAHKMEMYKVPYISDWAENKSKGA
ncbi:MAG: zinc ribbon domain-containing protein [Acidobacteria bacterium]|nr:zinc ribbon domain-containing protein [Acidobacteriota bacterium]